MTVIARDTVASDHLVYSWPFPIGPECEVSCADDEQVVMCPAWMVGDRLGPGRHRWRTPDPTRPVGAFFVLTAPVEVSFDMVTGFLIPATGQPVRLRACGSLQIRCADPGLLIAQFVGLPFDQVNDGVLRSVSRSVERMLARLLTRRVVMSGTPVAVTEAGMLPGIIDELIAYNPTAGAVFGVELIRVGFLVIAADDGSTPYLPLPARNLDWSSPIQRIPDVHVQANGSRHGRPTVPAPPPPSQAPPQPSPPRQFERPPTPRPSAHGDTIRGMPAPTPPRGVPETAGHAQGRPAGQDPRPAVASGEIIVRSKGAQAAGAARRKSSTLPLPTTAGAPSTPPSPASRGSTAGPSAPTAPMAPLARPSTPAPAAPRRVPPVEVPRAADEITQPGIDPRSLPPVGPGKRAPAAAASPGGSDALGAIMGIGMSSIGHSPVGEVAGQVGQTPTKVPPGGRVLVPGPNGLMQSATVRQLLQGYYELEVGSSGQTIWVPIAGVVPE